MTPTLILLNLIGGICLLLYGLRQIKRSVMRGYGAHLRGFLAACTSNRLTGFLAGVTSTVLLQSALTVVLLLATFLGQKMLITQAALPVMIGADFGISVVAQVLTLNLSFLAPLFLLMGLALITSSSHRKKIQNMGIAVFGLGLMLFALGVLREASIPLKESSALPYLLHPLEIDPIFTIIVAALLTWLFHSSLAFLMLVVSFVASGAISPHLGLQLALGANMGGSINAIASTLRSEPAAVRLPVANLLMRASLVFLVLPFMTQIESWLDHFDPDTARQIVHFHLGFNLLVATVFLPLTPFVAWIAQKLVPDRDTTAEEMRPKYLDERNMDTPVVALSAAARETLRIADFVTDMLVKTLQVFKEGNENKIKEIQAQDTVVDTLHRAVKIYMARAMELSLNAKEAQRHLQIINFATTLEHIGDTIDKSMMPMALRLIKNHRRFSAQGMSEIEEMFDLVLASMRMAETVFMSSDSGLARQLVEGKQAVIAAERRASANHYARLNQGVPESLETSSIHLDLLRDLQRINGDVVTVAYPLLEETGELLKTRLTTPRLLSLEPDLREEG